MTGRHHTLLQSVALVQLCQVSRQQTFTLLSSGRSVNNFQALQNGACLCSHRVIRLAAGTEARAVLESADSEGPRENLKRRVQRGPKGAGGIRDSSSPGRLFLFTLFFILLLHLWTGPQGEGVIEN